MDCSPTGWLRGSFYFSPFWRLLRASYRIEHGLAADASIDDDGVEAARDLLAAVESNDMSAVPEAVRAAYALWVEDREPRGLVEAQLLTSRSFDEIATACSLTEPVVRIYSQIFFDVRSRLQFRDWVMSLAVRSHPLNDFAGPQPGGVWKFFAFVGGELVLDVIVAVTSDRPLPDWLARQFAKDRVEEKRLRLRAKLAVAALTAKGAHQLGSVVELAEQLRRLDKEAGRPVDGADALSPVVREFYTVLARPQRVEPGADVHTPAQGATPGCGRVRTEPNPPEPHNGGDRDR
jgi:hypothetical protein